MAYKVLITDEAEADFDRFIYYICYVLKNRQAAGSVIDDFEISKDKLSDMAGSLPYCLNPNLKALGYRKMHFQTHRYIMLYRIEDNLAIVDNIFHELQDYENILS